MANGSAYKFDPEARYAALDERVANLGSRQSTLETTTSRGFAQVEQSIASLSNETRNALTSLSNEFRSNQKPQWQAIGVALTFAVVLGGLVYWPIRENQADMKQQLRDLSGSALSVEGFKDFKATYDSNRLVSRQDNDTKLASIQANIATVTLQTVPRGEHERIWQADQYRFTDLQRQIDDQKKAFGDTYSLRDTILDLKTRLDRTEAELGRGKPSAP